MKERIKCQGLLGLIFGHKFVKNAGDYTFRDGYCYRCGMSAVSWSVVEEPR